MKILYVTNHKSIAEANGGYISDYLNDLVFYGLYEIFGTQVTDSTQIISLYKTNENFINKQKLWGGFSTFWLIEKDLVDRNNIEAKIKDKYYDLIIYGTIKRCNDYYLLVSSIYPANRIIIIDGSDEQNIDYKYLKHPYFKRELNQVLPNVFPISFSIPISKFVIDSDSIRKNKIFGGVFPGLDNTYTFFEEQAFYKDYQQSYFGLTMKKDGWDCMRHYEILCNYCMPYFIDIENCPKNTLVNFPKSIIKQSMNLFNSPNFTERIYFELLDEIFQYTKSNLTTKYTAEKLLEAVL